MEARKEVVEGGNKMGNGGEKAPAEELEKGGDGAGLWGL